MALLQAQRRSRYGLEPSSALRCVPGWAARRLCGCAVPGSAACSGVAWAWPVASREPRARSSAALAAGEQALRWRGEKGSWAGAGEQPSMRR